MGDIIVKKPGMFTTIQDEGRFHYQKSGMSVTGAMDIFSLRAANMLVFNETSEACIENTLVGCELEFESAAIIAVTGGDMSPKLNGSEVKMWSSIKVNRGDILSLGICKSGCRSYIAIGGGIDVPVVMGSKSTYIKGNIGGFKGRVLQANDNLNLCDKNFYTNYKKVELSEEFIPKYNSELKIRVVLGPQEDHFTERGIKTFLESIYKVTNQADRMGYRLDGETIQHKNGGDIISDGITMGSVQVPSHGKPIIMMADRQTTGGYTKIATVITPDINLIGQSKMGDNIKFEAISIEEAHKIYRDYNKMFQDIKEYIAKYKEKSIENNGPKTFKMKVNSKEYVVTIEEII